MPTATPATAAQRALGCRATPLSRLELLQLHHLVSYLALSEDGVMRLTPYPEIAEKLHLRGESCVWHHAGSVRPAGCDGRCEPDVTGWWLPGMVAP